MRNILIILIILLYTTNVWSQEKTLKEQALDKFKLEHYNEAIELLEKAVKLTPNDAEIHYYLGWFNHYRAYDSRALVGYDFSYSEQIFKYFDKALELNPDYGDAKYFYGAECSANAFESMQSYDLPKLKYYYQLANEKGAYPEWMKEQGRNFLNSCDKNAILFIGGNMDFDISTYLQLCENFRTDITIIPIVNIERPWYVRFLRDGLKGGVRAINLSLTDRQIMDIHPYKWKTTDVLINVSPSDKRSLDLSENYQLKWTVFPDLISDRMHAKIESEKESKRQYLSPQRAILLQIIEDNFSQRPIYFSNFTSPTLYGGLEMYFQNSGLVSRLMPIITKDTEYAFNTDKIIKFLNEESIINYKTIKDYDIPRVSGVVTYGYLNSVYNLANYYKKENKTKELNQLIDLFEKHLKIGFNPRYENNVERFLKDD